MQISYTFYLKARCVETTIIMEKSFLTKLEWIAPLKRGNSFDINELRLSPVCLPITYISLNICLKFQYNHSSRNIKQLK